MPERRRTTTRSNIRGERALAHATLTALLLLTFCWPAQPQERHEYAPIEERTINYADWTFKDLDGKPVNLRGFAQDKRLVLVVYFAPWCPNWRYEAPVISRLLDKYRTHGFEVVAISEYAPEEETRRFFGKERPPYTVVIESNARDARTQTTHYAYRQRSGDRRNWGSPYNIFLEPVKLNSSGQLLTEKAWVANGELVEAEAEKFIRARLGLKEEGEKPPACPATRPATR
ncbi:MAG: hypothetical protein C4334_14395 [Pyrinomonas sp.]|uniref:TlpA disulfide reductase family protein n=1 Tax=Pyrinomonas sp. TaxID=2080306 RepID=UPI00332CA7CB